MPLCTIHLISLHPNTPDPLLTFLSALKSSNASPLIVSRVIRWIILPSQISTEHLLARNIQWDFLLILPNADALPSQLADMARDHWSITAGVPSRLIQDFDKKNSDLIHPDSSSVPKLSTETAKPGKTTVSSQNLELSQTLEDWIQDFVKGGTSESQGAVSMLNLLAFHAGKKAEYLKYGTAFAESIGSRHGGNAKIVGSVIDSGGSALATQGWDEIALAHYPSILHFREMLLSKDYQEVNHRYRVGSLKDTCILMTSEVRLLEGLGPSRPRL